MLIETERIGTGIRVGNLYYVEDQVESTSSQHSNGRKKKKTRKKVPFVSRWEPCDTDTVFGECF